MYRVELKALQVPRGLFVSSQFLMYRVELKETGFLAFEQSLVPKTFLMYRVELKAAFGSL